MKSIDDQIFIKIRKAKGGSLFFIEDFLSFGSSEAVRKALERMVKKGEISRVSRGIYARLKTHDIFGEIQPSTEEIAQAIAKRDKARIIPTGVLALNALGLSTQVPMKVVYLTDGSARTVKIGKQSIKFKKASPRNFRVIGEINKLVIQALKEIGKEDVTNEEIEVILEHLCKQEKHILEHDIKLAPEWIRIIMRQALINIDNE
jgi:predicted transcriptional regulator of viral defense system